jgi:cysteine desulfurase
MAVYLDHNASSPLRPEVFEVMRPWLEGEPAANASSPHRAGQRARLAVERARELVADLLDCEPLEVVFTSGGTEANNLALSAALAGQAGGRVVTSAIEHPSVEAGCAALESSGGAVTRIAPGGDGTVRARDFVTAMEGGARLVSLMLANNETGAIQPVGCVARAVKSSTLRHSDAIQAAGRIPVSVRDLGVDMLSVSAHKMGGPQGAGALVVRRGTPFEPLLRGGPQERRRRAGTEPVALLAGFGEAARLARLEMGRWESVCAPLRDRFEDEVRGIDSSARVHAASVRLPNTSSVAFPGRSAEAIAMALDLAGVAVSTGSACSSGATLPSRVLQAHGFDEEEVRGTIRVSFGPSNTAADLDRLLEELRAVLARIAPVHAGKAVR